MVKMYERVLFFFTGTCEEIFLVLIKVEFQETSIMEEFTKINNTTMFQTNGLRELSSCTIHIYLAIHLLLTDQTRTLFPYYDTAEF